MPIKSENRHLYPKNWKSEIRPRILRRAGDKCEFCGVPNHSHILRSGSKWEPVSPGTPGVVWIVLTIAHLDHDPANCADDNLRALCQRCHLTYDAKHHAQTAKANRERKAGPMLFTEAQS